MKVMQYFATAFFFLAGLVLLLAPEAHAVTPATAFVPTRFTVADQGKVGAPDVVLIPGLGSSSAVWDAEAKLLAPNYRLHIVQVNGFAGAPAGVNATGPILPGIVEELHQYILSAKMTPVVVGHSLGGLLTMMLADKYPADVKKMIIVDTLPYYAVLFKPDATVEAMKPQADVLKQQIVAAPADQFAAMQGAVVPQLVKNTDAQKIVAGWDVAGDRVVFAQAMYDDLLTDLRGEIATIKTPMLLLYPYDAAMGDAAKVDAMYHGAYAAKPNATLVRVDDSRHFIMFDQPAKMDAAIEGYLK